MRDATVDPWAVSADAFPGDGSPAEQARFLLNFAVLAPSSHNSQPWRFRLDAARVDLLADPARRLHVVDPGGRELRISCGAALFHLRVALAHFGIPPSIDLLPDSAQPDLLAQVRLGQGTVPALPAEFFPAILRRRTNRAAFLPDRPPPATITTLHDAAQAEGAWLHELADEHTRFAVTDLVTAGDRAQWADPAFRRELASWMHPSWTRSLDGMPGNALEEGSLESLVAPLLVRTCDLGSGRAAADRKLATESPGRPRAASSSRRQPPACRSRSSTSQSRFPRSGHGWPPLPAAPAGLRCCCELRSGPPAHTPRRPVAEVLIPAGA